MNEINNIADRLSFGTKTGLSEFNLLRNELKIHSSIINHIKITKKKINYSILKHFSGTFIPKTIVDDIKNNKKSHRIILSNNSLKLIFLVSYNKINVKNFFLMAFKAFIISHYLKYKLKKNKKMVIKIYYTPSNIPKKINNSKEIGVENCNSGFTSFFLDQPNYICIYREEENSKVLIHELLHYFGLDFSHLQTKMNEKFIKNFDVITSPKYINIFEAFVDFYAILLNSLLNSILFELKIESIIKLEKAYQNEIVKKILNFYKMTHILSSKNTTNNKLIQKSNVLSYYFIKNCLMNNMLSTINNFPLFTKWNNKKVENFYKYILINLKKHDIINHENCKPDFSLKMTYFNL